MNRIKGLGGKLGIILCSALLEFTACGQVSVAVVLPSVEIHTESDFYAPLTPQGEWVVVGGYGRCWRPGHVARDWRPYCNGNWQRTDAGWYWVSDEPWAWATYHYGRWNYTDQDGWYWVPQTQWAPAWVSWHSGGGYVGWAPMYPVNVKIISPQAYVFVEERHFMEPVRSTTVVLNNNIIINKVVIHDAPATTVIEKAGGRKVQVVPVQELRHKTEAVAISKQPARPATAPVGSTEKKAVGTLPSPQAVKPVGAPHELPAPTPNDHVARSENQKPATTAPDLKPEARSDGIHTPTVKEPIAPAPDKHVVKQPKRSKPVEKQNERPAGENPAPSEKSAPGSADKEHEGKPKE